MRLGKPPIVPALKPKTRRWSGRNPSARHGSGLIRQHLGGCGILFNQRGVLLRGLVHLRQRILDLVPAYTFLIKSTISLSAVPARLTSSTPSRTWPLLLVMSSLISLAAWGGALSEVAHLRSHDGETAASLARVWWLDRGVEREEIAEFWQWSLSASYVGALYISHKQSAPAIGRGAASFPLTAGQRRSPRSCSRNVNRLMRSR